MEVFLIIKAIQSKCQKKNDLSRWENNYFVYLQIHRPFRPNSTLELGEMVYIYYRRENEDDQYRLNMLSCGSEWLWVCMGVIRRVLYSTLLYSTRLDLIASKKLTGPLPIEKEDGVTFIPTSSAK